MIHNERQATIKLKIRKTDGKPNLEEASNKKLTAFHNSFYPALIIADLLELVYNLFKIMLFYKTELYINSDLTFE